MKRMMLILFISLISAANGYTQAVFDIKKPLFTLDSLSFNPWMILFISDDAPEVLPPWLGGGYPSGSHCMNTGKKMMTKDSTFDYISHTSFNTTCYLWGIRCKTSPLPGSESCAKSASKANNKNSEKPVLPEKSKK